jgi:hypothetical protein
MTTYILPRDEQRPLQLRGKIIGSASTKVSPGGLENRRWTEVQIFQTPDSGYAISIIGKSNIEGETPRSWATTAPTPALLSQLVANHYGKIHFAVQKALADAGIWEQTAVVAEEIATEALSEFARDSEMQNCTLYRDDKVQIIVGVRAGDNRPLLYIDMDDPLNVAEAERVTMTMFRAIEDARTRDKTF